jgi:phosphoglycolate phosphatase-like HAD superfamily hydrolase
VRHARDLAAWQPRHDTLVGLDSDGCVFDTMETKQRDHFFPLIVRFWGLDRVAAHVTAAAEFVNLRSRWRGRNRFLNLLKTFERLAETDAVRAAGVALPDLAGLRAYCESGVPLGNPTLASEAARTGDAELRRVLAWSEAVNADIEARMNPAPPFAWAARALALIRERSDAMVISQTPLEALEREWRLHGLAGTVGLVAGQEAGSKTEQLRAVAAGRYRPDRVIVLGDAPGDREAALACGAWFYPIMPGREEASWERFCREDYDRFLAGTFGPRDAAELAAAFDAALPDAPPRA